jgi:hypothetical protein
MNFGTYIKQPADTLDYDLDYLEWLTPGDSVINAEVVVEPATDLAVDAVFISSPIVKLWLSGGLSGTSYKLTITITTDNGRIKQDEFKLKVKDF